LPIQSYRDLKVWQAGVDLVTQVYKLTEKFPKSESFGLTSQIQRAAVSIPSNIAEGHARGSGREFNRFILIGLGSLAEVETQMVIAENIGFVSKDETRSIFEAAGQLGKMLRGLQKSIKGRD
jgi:four helix bundle protein